MGSAYPLSVSTVHPLFRIRSAISDLKETSGKAIFSLQTVGIEAILKKQMSTRPDIPPAVLNVLHIFQHLTV